MGKCKHSWRHYKDDLGISLNIPIGSTKIVSEFFRICEKCMLKQKQNPWSSEEFKWENYDIYNKEEKREIKLRQILKGKT